jgi:hypothetical protein
MRDIDILVRPADAGRTVVTLEAAGYRSDAAAVNFHHLPGMRKPGAP